MNRDYMGLEWVQREIEQTLLQSEKTLQVYIEQRDLTALRQCVTCVHQVQGTLQMIGFGALAEFTAVIEQVAQQFLSKKLDFSDQHLAVLLRAIRHLPMFLAQPPQTDEVARLTLLALLQELNAITDASHVAHPNSDQPSSAELESVQPSPSESLVAASSTATVDIVDPAYLPSVLKKIHQLFHFARLNILRQENVNENIAYLEKALVRLQHLATQMSPTLAALCQLSVLWLQSLDDAFQSGTDQSVLAELDGLFESLVQQGALTANLSLVEKLFSQLLKRMQNHSAPEIAKINQQYVISRDQHRASLTRGILLQLDKEGMAKAVDVIGQQLRVFQAAVEIFLESEQQQHTLLQPCDLACQQLATSLEVLQQFELQRNVQQLQSTIQQLVATKGCFSAEQLDGIADDVLKVDSMLQYLAKTSPLAMTASFDAANQVLQLAKLETLKTCRAELRLIKEAIVMCVSSQASVATLAPLPEQFARLVGALSILNFSACVHLIQQFLDFLRQLIDQVAEPISAQWELLADIIAGFDYYLECVALNQDVADKVLNVIQQKLHALALKADLLLEQELTTDAVIEAHIANDVSEDENDKAIAEEVIEAHEQDSSHEVAATAIVEEAIIEAAIVEAVIADADTADAITSVALTNEDDNHNSLIDDEVLEVFVEEMGEVQQTLDDGFSQWQAAPNDVGAMKEIRRAFHTIKGSGRMVGALSISELAWHSENLLNRLLDRTIRVSPDIINTLQLVILRLPALLHDFQQQQQQQQSLSADLQQLQQRLQSLAVEALLTSTLQSHTDRSDADHLPDPDHCASQSPSLSPAVDAIALPATQNSLVVETAIETDIETDIETFTEIPSEANASKHDMPLVSSDNKVNANTVFDPVLLGIFSEEALSHLVAIENYLLACEDTYEIDESLSRALHTLKGSAYMANVKGIVAVVAPTEQLIKVMYLRRLPLSSELQCYLTDFVMAIRDVLPQLLQNPAIEVTDRAALLSRLLGFYRHYFAVDSLESDLEQLSSMLESPSLHAMLLPESIDLLQNADALLLQLQENSAAHVLASESLCRALRHVAEKSLAQQPVIANLCDLLEQCHARLRQASLQQKTLDASVFDWLQQGHSSLLDLLDAAAVGQTLTVADPVLSQLNIIAEGGHTANSASESLVSDEFVGDAFVDEEPINEAPISEMLDAMVEPESVVIEAVALDDLDDVVENNAAVQANMVAWQANNDFAEGELVEIFIEEATDIIEALASLLTSWLADHSNSLKVEELQSELHTLKGGARLSGLMDFAQFSEHLEVFYEAISDGRVGFSAELAELLSGCQQQLSEMLQQLRQGHPIQFSSIWIERIKYFMSDAYQHALRGARDLEEDYELAVDKALLDAEDDARIEEPRIQEKHIQADSVVSASSSPKEKTSNKTTENTIDFSADVAWLFGPEFDRDIFDIFHEEAEELLENVDQCLHDWSTESANNEYLQELLRALHTLKGSARLAGLSQLGDLAHHFETYLGSQTGSPDGHFFRQAQQHFDVIEQGLKTLKLAYELGPDAYAEKLAAAQVSPTALIDGQPVSVVEEIAELDAASEIEAAPGFEPDNLQQAPFVPVAAVPVNKAKIDAVSPLSTELEARSSTPVSASNIKADSGIKELPFAPPVKGRKLGYAARQHDRAAQQEMVKVHGVLLERLVNLAGETTISTGRIETQVTSFALTLNDLTATIARVTDLLRRLDLETEAHMAYRYESQLSSKEEFDPLEMDRYSMLHQLSRSLAESASDIADLKDTLSNNIRDTESLLMQQARINTQLQEGLMRTQLVPFGRLLPRLRRMVRQLSDELHKQVNLEVVNAEGEMDRNVLDRMVAPLEHMLRNSVDHGIELPAQRLAAGKPAEGRITLLLTREGGEVVLRLSDDGRGMQLESIKRQAILSGLMKADADLSENDILQFVFKPGFSTAEKVTQISGRGVGMDVVYSEIKQLGGSMKIHSALGVGTQFTIRLPFTVAITRALMVRVGDDAYAIPLTSIEGVLRVSPQELMTYYQDHDAPKFTYGDRRYRVQYLGAYVQGVTSPPLQGLEKPVPILLVRSGDSAVALHVDALIGSREVVVKSLGPQLSAVSGISGATILGDGRVVIILDVVALLRAERAGLGVIAQDSDIALDPHKRGRATPLVMVVDDSVTVRKVTSRLLERHGLDVLVAKDGVDAMTKLQDVLPDLILLDIEMPRMDGFEVASQVRHNERLQDVPIIMITSRTGEKHRNRALSLGVNDFMGKPYQETHLVEAMQAILGKEAVKT